MTCKYVFPTGHNRAGQPCEKNQYHPDHSKADHPEGCSGGTAVGCTFHPYVAVDVIDITPSMEGFASSAKLFVETILRDIRSARTAADRDLLVEALKIAGHLGREGRDDLLVQLVKYAMEVPA